MIRTANPNGLARYVHGKSCPICGGSENDPRGNGSRCFGFLSRDGDYAHCTREEYGVGCPYHETSSTYSHRLKGPCRCGEEHHPADEPSHGKAKARKKRGEIERIYPYHDADGRVLFEVVRFKNPKDFVQRQPHPKPGEKWSVEGIPKVPYHLPAILAAQPGSRVWICEGEKDAENLKDAGRLATCNPGGAGKWEDSFSPFFAGLECCISPHNDPAGRDHARQVAQSLHGVAKGVKVVELPGLPPKGDVSDFLASGGTIEELDGLADAAREWMPRGDEPPRRDGRKVPEDRDGEPDWILTDRGAWSPCVTNLVRWLQWKGRDKDYVRDEFLDTLTVNGREIDDEDRTRLVIAVEEDRRVAATTSKAKEAIAVVAARNAVDSLKDYFAAITWDGMPRVDTYFERVYDAVAMCFANHQGEITPQEYEDAERYCRFVSRSFLIGLAARALDPGCKVDTMPILIGDQGRNKSESLRALCPNPDWFTDDIGDIHTKDAWANLNGILIIEFGEFNRLMRASAAAVKSFLSKRDDRYRAAFGHYTVRHRRRCIFVGSTNEDMPLTDIENRRFYPITVAMANLEYIRENRDQVLAEAAHRFRSGEPWWTLDDDILDIVKDRQDMAQKPDAWATALAEKLPGLGATFTQSEAFDVLDIPVERRTGRAVNDMGNALKKAGCKSLPRQRINGVRATVYANPAKADVGNSDVDRGGQG